MSDRPNVIEPAQRIAAKVAGLAYLIPVAIIIYANFGIRDGLFVSGDWAETVRRIADAEGIFRFSVALDVVYCVGVVVLLSALYVVLSPVNRHLALLATLWKLVYVGTAVLTALSFLNVVLLATEPAYAETLGAEPLQARLWFEWATVDDKYYVGLVFWALSSTVIGWLWLKSRYIPTALAAFGLVSSAWCAFCALAYNVNPAFSRVVNLWWFDSPMAVFDIILSVWLLSKGLRGVPAPAAADGR